MTKSKLKKSYCIMSFVFAVAVLIIALTLSMGQTRVYAADTSSDMITGLSNTDSSDGLTDATSDINNGLSITYNNDTGAVSTPIKALLVLTIISLAPSILIMMTSYTRIIIVLHFLRTAIGTQTAPPNQILVGLALFLTKMPYSRWTMATLPLRRHTRRRRHRFVTLCTVRHRKRICIFLWISMEKIIQIR